MSDSDYMTETSLISITEKISTGDLGIITSFCCCMRSTLLATQRTSPHHGSTLQDQLCDNSLVGHSEFKPITWADNLQEFVKGIKMADVNHIPFIHKNFCHDGIWYPNIVLPSSLEALKTFELRHDDVFVLTFPKSGTHWMLEIIGLILNDGYPDRIDRTLYSSTLEMINMDQAFPKSVEDDIENPMDMTPFLNVADAAPSPRAMMTHLRLERLPKNLFKKTKAVYLARNPKDVTTSWFNFVGHSEFNPITWEDNLKEFIEGKMHWGPWEQHVTEFWKKSKEEDNLLFIVYEDLLRNPTENIRRISEHIDRPLSEEALHRVVRDCSMASMKQTYQKIAQSGKQSFTKASGEYPFLNKGVCGAWKNRFTVAQNEMFNTWYQDKMAEVPLKFSFD